MRNRLSETMLHYLKKFFLSLFLLWFTSAAFCLDLELTQGINAAFPIGVNLFEGLEYSHEITDIIKNDLRLSGQFNIVSHGDSNQKSQLTLQQWRNSGADSVLSGTVTPIGGATYQVHFDLFDAAAQGRLLLAKSYKVNSHDMRALAHHISDEIYQKLTGEKGVFSTKIAYILVQNGDNKRKYSLEVADVDGYNPLSLLVSTEPIMSPAWSPDGQFIAYVTFENKRAQIYTVHVATGKRRLITSFPGINGAPAWSPNGKEMAVVLSKSGVPKIYKIDLKSGAMKQLTFGQAIDTEPRYAPDGQSLLFTSGRGGAPQVYKLDLASGKISRITYDGNYNARASFTPNQAKIVLLHRKDRHFNIGVQNVASGRISPITSSPMDESPSVAPNGRLVLYATKSGAQGILGVVSIDGRIHLRLPSRQGDVQEPAWSPFLG